MAGYSPERAMREFLRRGGQDQRGLDDLARQVAAKRRARRAVWFAPALGLLAVPAWIAANVSTAPCECPETAAAANDGQSDSASNLAASAPRAKQNIAYSNEMIKFLREVNVDANNVGWFTSTSMGNFVNLQTIENQYFYQNAPNEKTVALVYDVSRSSQGAMNLRAYRLSPAFMTAYKEGKFTTERYAR